MPSQQGQMQQNTQTMQQLPPNILTAKDLSFLKDQMSWLLGAVKKCHHYAQACQDAQVRQIIEQVCATHQRQYDALLKHCNQQGQTGNAQPTMQ